MSSESCVIQQKAPFVYFGGKSKIAPEIWRRLGDVKNYVEPFAGSLAILLSRPHEPRIETVNDIDCLLSNFWRSVSKDPELTAKHADWPVNENDLHARHAWLVSNKDDIRSRIEGDPEWFDAKAAGWWVWGINAWIGGGWCSGAGPWSVVDGELINRQLTHLGNAGLGINRQLPHLGNAGKGVHKGGIYDMFFSLSERLRNVRVCCGDWSRICTPSVTTKHGTTAVLLDPPYGSKANRANELYAHDSTSVADDVRAWAIERGDDPLIRIALCGYTEEHDSLIPSSWERLPWKAAKGYGGQRKDGTTNENGSRECVWFSTHCLKTDLFEMN